MDILIDDAIFVSDEEKQRFIHTVKSLDIEYHISGLVETQTSDNLIAQYNLSNKTFVYGALPFCRRRPVNVLPGNFLLSTKSKFTSPTHNNIYFYFQLLDGVKSRCLVKSTKIDNVLNHDASIMYGSLSYNDYLNKIIDEFTNSSVYDSGKVFIRANAPFKVHPSTVVSINDLFEFIHENNYKNTMYGFVIAPYKEIKDEVRCVVHRGKIITASYYIMNQQIIYKETFAVRELQEILDSSLKPSMKMINIPLVIDFAKLADTGHWKIIEVNSLSTSGLYECSIEKILKCVREVMDNE